LSAWIFSHTGAGSTIVGHSSLKKKKKKKMYDN
jgi:hypothetical protein